MTNEHNELSFDHLDQVSGGTLWGLTRLVHIEGHTFPKPWEAFLHEQTGGSALNSLLTGHLF
jgi:hypothetical protein